MLITSPDAFFVPSDKPWLELTRLTVNRDGLKLGHDIQHKANVAWAKRIDVVIGSRYKEENVSTSDEDVSRDTWEQLIREVETGMWGGILVWRADRLTRQAFEFERLARIARKQNALIACSYDNITTIDPQGLRRIRDQIAQAEQEVSTLQLRIIANSKERKSIGLYHGGSRRPWCFEGSKKDKKTGRIKNSGRVGMKHDKVEVALALEAADRIAWKGWDYGDVIKDWHARTPPVYGVTGAPWSVTTLRNALTAPRMIGKVAIAKVSAETGKSVEKLKKAQWKPVLDEETWNQLRSMRCSATHKEGKLKYLLTPISECGRCGQRLSGCTRKYKKQGVLVPTATYRCRSHLNDKARGACGKLNVVARPVEDLVKAFIFERLERTREFGTGVFGADDLEPKLAAESAEANRLAAELETLREAQQSPEDRLPMSEYIALRRGLNQELQTAKARASSLLAQLTVPIPIDADWDDLWVWFDHLTFGQQSKLVQAHVRKAVVLPPGRSGRYFKPERVQITPTDAQEADGLSDEAAV